jgi:phenylpyruvate tautomerase PptA (4-oxalocrotonate tautomerase family)
MPLLTVQTNCPIENKPDVCRELSRQTAQILGKPESYVMVMVQDKQSLTFAGTDEAAAYLQLKSLGLPESETTVFSQQLCEKIHQLLNIETGRIYIEFSSPARHLWGWDNRTF